MADTCPLGALPVDLLVRVLLEVSTYTTHCLERRGHARFIYKVQLGQMEPALTLARFACTTVVFKAVCAARAAQLWEAAYRFRFAHAMTNAGVCHGPLAAVVDSFLIDWLRRYQLLHDRCRAQGLIRWTTAAAPTVAEPSVAEINANFAFFVFLRFGPEVYSIPTICERAVEMRLMVDDDDGAWSFTNMVPVTYPADAAPFIVELFVRRRADGAAAFMLSASAYCDYVDQGNYHLQVEAESGTAWCLRAIKLSDDHTAVEFLNGYLSLPHHFESDNEWAGSVDETGEITVVASEHADDAGGMNLERFEWCFSNREKARELQEMYGGHDNHYTLPPDRPATVADLYRILSSDSSSFGLTWR